MLFEEAAGCYEANPESVTTAGTAGASEREVLRFMFERVSDEYTSMAHPRGCLVNSAPELAGNRADNRAITATRLEEVAGSAGVNRDPRRSQPSRTCCS